MYNIIKAQQIKLFSNRAADALFSKTAGAAPTRSARMERDLASGDAAVPGCPRGSVVAGTVARASTGLEMGHESEATAHWPRWCNGS